MSDLKFALRFAARHPAFAAVTVLVLGLGIGINTAVFALINGVLFRPLPVPNPDGIRFFYLSDPETPREWAAFLYRDFGTLRETYGEFAQLAARSGDSAQIVTQGDVQPARGELVTTNYFEVLGIKPVIGRMLVPGEDDDVTAPPVVVVSQAFWTARLQADPAALGTTIMLDGRPYIVVGVAPATFPGTLGPWEKAQYWVSLEQRAEDKKCRIPDYRSTAPVTVVGRLRDPEAAARLDAAVAASASSGIRFQPTIVRMDLPSGGRPWPVVVQSTARNRLPFDLGGAVVPDHLAAALMCASTLVLLIAVSNLTGLLLARGATRREELVTRLTLGASRVRVLRGLVFEQLVLAVPGIVAGLLIARGLIGLFVLVTPATYSPSPLVSTRGVLGLGIDLPFDTRVLTFAILLGLAASLLTGLGPAFQAIASAARITPSPSGSSGRLRKFILLPQICLSVVLTLTSGVLIRTVLASELREPGYESKQAVYVPLAFPAACRNVDRNAAFLQTRRAEQELLVTRIEARLASLHGVTAASGTSSLPFEAPRVNNQWIKAFDVTTDARPFQFVARGDVAPAYFEALQIPLLAGRNFTAADRMAKPRVAIVSDSLARRLWGAGAAIGHHVEFRDPDGSGPVELMEVVGVADDVRSPLAERVVDMVYVPAAPDFPWLRTIVARGSGSTASTIDAVRRAIHDVDSRLQIGTGRTVAAGASDLQYPRRVAAGILGLSGLAGLTLAALGLYGLLSYSVARRVNEIGVRMALGAAHADIASLILKDAARVAVAGLAAGVVLAYVAVGVTSARVVALPRIDAVTAIVVLTVLGTVIFTASYVPARRAARVDPMEALRHL